MIDHELVSLLDEHKDERIYFVGVGSEIGGDEAGIKLLIEKIINLARDDIDGLWTDARPENFLKEIKGSKAGHFVFVQASSFGGRPGETTVKPIHEHDIASLHESPLTSIAHYLSHEVEVKSSIMYVEPKSLMIGEVSTEIREATGRIVEQIKTKKNASK